ncbi:MAG: GIY-YIG nuclease family protein [Candidatus Omnitrophica bacterium]|nr:GIY-YIG nuclease family protein [Candidatus Omnitrophota bacterium]
MKRYYIYILASKRNGTLYLGVTNNLIRRVKQHKERCAGGFTRQYGVDKSVYFEECNDVRDAIEGETRIKKWERRWKIRLIEERNPHWKDLYFDLTA